eukprot:11196411-Lingulodinium_polyedra.AAC.1
MAKATERAAGHTAPKEGAQQLDDQGLWIEPVAKLTKSKTKDGLTTKRRRIPTQIPAGKYWTGQ